MRQFWFLMAVISLGGSVLGVVRAQAGEADGGEVVLRQPVTLSAAEKVEEARTIVMRGTRLSERVTNLLNEARRDVDMIRVTCLNDKLSQIHAALHTAEGRLAALTNAVDPGVQNHEYTMVTVVGQKFAVLDQEANQCVGQDIYETSASTNSMAVDESQAGTEEDSGEAPQPPEPVIVGSIAPPRASGTF